MSNACKSWNTTTQPVCSKQWSDRATLSREWTEKKLLLIDPVTPIFSSSQTLSRTSTSHTKHHHLQVIETPYTLFKLFVNASNGQKQDNSLNLALGRKNLTDEQQVKSLPFICEPHLKTTATSLAVSVCFCVPLCQSLSLSFFWPHNGSISIWSGFSFERKTGIKRQ